MNSRLPLRLPWPVVAIAGLLACQPALAAEFYVHPEGNDAHPGTLAQPFATVTRAQDTAAPGDTVWIRGGQYVFSGTKIEIGILLTKSGQEGKRINYWAYQNETPVFDFHQLATPVRIRGISVKADWLHLRGLEIRGVQQILTNTNESWGIRVEGGSHNIFERLNLHHNEGPGFFIAAGGHNLVLNCDSHHNSDPDKGGENADGFGGHSAQEGNVFRGCRAWSNSDDGYDLIHARAAHTIEHCWAWSNGFIPDTQQRAGNGGGFKLGGWLLNPARFPGHIPTHTITHSLAFNNRAEGFNANYQPGMIRFYNNTAFNNPRQFDLKVAPRFTKPVTHVLRNNVALGDAPPMSGTSAIHPTISSIPGTSRTSRSPPTISRASCPTASTARVSRMAVCPTSPSCAPSPAADSSTPASPSNSPSKAAPPTSVPSRRSRGRAASPLWPSLAAFLSRRWLNRIESVCRQRLYHIIAEVGGGLTRGRAGNTNIA